VRPKRIRFRHLPDQLPDLAVLSRPPWAVVSGDARPVGGETPSMPSENSFRRNDDECLRPALPGSGQESTEEAIELPEFRSPTSSVQDGELLAEREVLECQLRAEPQGAGIRESNRRIVRIMPAMCRAPRYRESTGSTRPGFWRWTTSMDCLLAAALTLLLLLSNVGLEPLHARRRR
jgi:hypothetical protein